MSCDCTVWSVVGSAGDTVDRLIRSVSSLRNSATFRMALAVFADISSTRLFVLTEEDAFVTVLFPLTKLERVAAMLAAVVLVC